MSESASDGSEPVGGETPDGGPRVVYAPGATNRYDHRNDVVYLDERLKDYPLAHRLIKEHELAHADNRDTLSCLWLEFRTDLRRYFSTDTEIEATRRYMQEKQPERPVGIMTQFGFFVVGVLREFWKLVLAPTGKAYRVSKNALAAIRARLGIGQERDSA